MATPVAIVVATMVATVTDRSLDGEDKQGLQRTCDWKRPTVGAFGRCLGSWVKRCRARCSIQQSEKPVGLLAWYIHAVADEMIE